MMVWVGTAQPITPVPRQPINPVPRQPSDPPEPEFNWHEHDYHYIESVPDDAPVRGRFTTPHVSYVASHKGCGCGYNADEYLCGDYHEFAEVVDLLEALTADERQDFLASQRSRERLRDVVTAALAGGEVQVFACWAGDENVAALEHQEVDAEWCARQLQPLAERVLYRVRSPARGDREAARGPG